MSISELLSRICITARCHNRYSLSRAQIVTSNLMQNVGLRTSADIKDELPPKPKKPLTPYFRFMAQIRPELVKEYPNTRVTDIVKMVAERWEKTSPELRLNLAEEYKKDLLVYETERLKYEQQLSSDQKELMKRMKQEAVISKEKRKLKKKMKELGKPKKPCSAFLAFFNARLPSRGDVPFKVWQKEVAKEWANMSDEAKATYQQESSQAMENHRKQLQEWEGRMIRMGHIDVVRSEALIEPKQSRLKGKTVEAGKSK